MLEHGRDMRNTRQTPERDNQVTKSDISSPDDTGSSETRRFANRTHAGAVPHGRGGMKFRAPGGYRRCRNNSMPSTMASQLASMMLSETPIVPQLVSPSVVTMSTRVFEAVASWPSTMRTL